MCDPCNASHISKLKKSSLFDLYSKCSIDQLVVGDNFLDLKLSTVRIFYRFYKGTKLLVQHDMLLEFS